MKTYSQSAIFPVEPRDRVLSGMDMMLLWAGSAIAVNVWYSGGYLAQAGWINGIALIIAGSLAGSAIFAAAGIIGSELGVPSMVTVRPSFGIRGSYIMSLLNYVTLVGWTGWMIYINASAADKVGVLLAGTTAFPYWVALGAILCTALALLRAEGWKRFTQVTVTALVLVSLAINFLVFSRYGWGVLASKPSSGLPPGMVFDLALIIPVSWAPLAADYMRFSKSVRGSFIGAFIGQGSVNAWFYITGLACALAFGAYDPTVYVTEVGGLAFGVMALFVIWLGTITTTFLDIYSANMSIINIFPSVKEWQGSLVTGLLGGAIAFLPWLNDFVQFLDIIGAVFVPLFAVVLADYFLVRKRKYIPEELYRPSGAYWYSYGLRTTAIVSWAVGVCIYFAFQQGLPAAGATLPSFALTAALYILITKTGILKGG
jgi:putative hydroxymethylpyrimidine transporter CytX